ncbi:hypothetical protein M0804_002653 [Polistes exclamans]|nr:hypothetical protein M0804_002653 [Polistes exclamans]
MTCTASPTWISQSAKPECGLLLIIPRESSFAFEFKKKKKKKKLLLLILLLLLLLADVDAVAAVAAGSTHWMKLPCQQPVLFVLIVFFSKAARRVSAGEVERKKDREIKW